MKKRSQQVDDGGQYDCEIEADGDLPISVSHRLDILLPPRVIIYFTTNLVINIFVTINNQQNDKKDLGGDVIVQVVSEPADGRVVVKKGSSVTIKCLTRYVGIIMTSMLMIMLMIMVVVLIKKGSSVM